MANIQHLYRGVGDPNDNPDLELVGDAVGNHLYQDSNNSQSVWISTFYEEEGQVHHSEWVRMIIEADLSLLPVEFNQQPSFEGQNGFSVDDNKIYIAMWNQSESELAWRETGGVMGDWYTPQD